MSTIKKVIIAYRKLFLTDRLVFFSTLTDQLAELSEEAQELNSDSRRYVMNKFIPINKQTKKQQKDRVACLVQYYSKHRSTWGDLNPVTRTVPNGKGYNRNKQKQSVILLPGLQILHLQNHFDMVESDHFKNRSREGWDMDKKDRKAENGVRYYADGSSEKL